MKRMATPVLLTATILLGGGLFTQPQQAEASTTQQTVKQQKMYTTTANLNLRSGAGTKYKALLTIPKGKLVTYLSKSGVWYKVKYGTKTGYVSSTYIKVTTKSAVPLKREVKASVKKAPTKQSTPKPSTGGQVEMGSFYTIDSLNLRSGAGIEFGIITSIPKGGRVDQIGVNGNWYQVKCGTSIGWVNASYLSKTKVEDNSPNAGVQWLLSEGQKRTSDLLAQVKRSNLNDLFVTPVQGRLTSPYGIRSNPTAAGYEFHTGIDLANTTGTQVLATAGGVVDRVVNGTLGYGKYIVLRHDIGGMTFYSLYGHLNKIEVVPGEKVGRGEKIGQLGSTGRSTGPHLHFEIQNESRQNVNPQTFLD